MQRFQLLTASLRPLAEHNFLTFRGPFFVGKIVAPATISTRLFEHLFYVLGAAKLLGTAEIKRHSTSWEAEHISHCHNEPSVVKHVHQLMQTKTMEISIVGCFFYWGWVCVCLCVCVCVFFGRSPVSELLSTRDKSPRSPGGAVAKCGRIKLVFERECENDSDRHRQGVDWASGQPSRQGLTPITESSKKKNGN